MILHRRRAAKRDRLPRTISDTYRSQPQDAPMNPEDPCNIPCQPTHPEPPGKCIDEVDVAAVRKKMKDKGFARNVNRDDITNGAEQLGVNLDEHIAFVIESLKPVASQLGIAGSANTG